MQSEAGNNPFSIKGRSRKIFLTVIFVWKIYHWEMMS